ncbi:GerAB/ArcD/ProY family transporter [Paenibacillus puldeungensis]|uniref:GerAB/ArcD/ProY family transporter n=1 Tax=Paenibacillus puldeungensis TaxID=696536 RepID=A0ABW3S1I8_9BACL
MNPRKTRLAEFISAFTLFEIGSTTLFQIGAEAKQDAWLAMTLAACVGFLLLMLHLAIFKRDPKRDLFELCRHYFGKVLGNLAVIIFGAYFAYEASRNLRDVGELAAYMLLNRTPLFIIMLLCILVIANIIRYGPHAAFLLMLVLLPFIVFSYFLLISMIFGVGLPKLENMEPILEDGLGPVLKVVPDIISFPFAQTVLFLVFFPMVREEKGIEKSMLIGYTSVAIFLILVNHMNVLVLGTKLADTVSFPLLQVVQLIELAEIFERMDILFVLVLFIGLGAKLLFFYMGAVKGFSNLTRTSFKKWILPIGIAIYALSFASPNFTHHLWVGISVVLKYYPIIQIGLPALLFIVMLVRNKQRTREEEQMDNS